MLTACERLVLWPWLLFVLWFIERNEVEDHWIHLNKSLCLRLSNVRTGCSENKWHFVTQKTWKPTLDKPISGLISSRTTHHENWVWLIMTSVLGSIEPVLYKQRPHMRILYDTQTVLQPLGWYTGIIRKGNLYWMLEPTRFCKHYGCYFFLNSVHTRLLLIKPHLWYYIMLRSL